MRWLMGALFAGGLLLVVPGEEKAEVAAPVHLLAGGKPIDVQRQGHAAPFVGDFDGDGVPDLLVGQYDEGRLRIYRNLGTRAKPRFESFTWFTAQRAEDESARSLLPELRKTWADTFRNYQKASGEEADELRTTLTRLKDEIAKVQDIQERYRPQSQSHGFVWLFRRQALGK